MFLAAKILKEEGTIVPAPSVKKPVLQLGGLGPLSNCCPITTNVKVSLFRMVEKQPELKKIIQDILKEEAAGSLVRQNVKREYYLTHHKQDEKNIYSQVGDEIIEVVTLTGYSRKKPLAVFITCLGVSEENTSREFLSKAYIQLKDLLKDVSPALIIIDIGNNPNLITKPNKKDEARSKKFIIIDGEINIELFRKNNLEDDYRPPEQLAVQEFKTGNKMLNQQFLSRPEFKGIEASGNLLLIRRLERTARELQGSYWQTCRENKNMFLGMIQNSIYSLGNGLMEGALIIPIKNFVNDPFNLLVLVSVVIEYGFPNIFMIIDTKSAINSDKTVSNNQRFRGSLGKIAATFLGSSLLLNMLYPGFYNLLFGGFAWAGMLLAGLYLLCEFARGVAYIYENNNWSSFLNKIGQQNKHGMSIQFLKAVDQIPRTILGLIGFGVGWALMSVEPLWGLILAAVGGVLGSLAKFIIPYYGLNYDLLLKSNFILVNLNGEHNYEIIPGQALINFRKRTLLSALNRSNRQQARLAPADLEIVINEVNPQTVPGVKTRRRFFPSRIKASWVFTWPNGKKIVLKSSAKKAYKLVREEKEVLSRDPGRKQKQIRYFFREV